MAQAHEMLITDLWVEFRPANELGSVVVKFWRGNGCSVCAQGDTLDAALQELGRYIERIRQQPRKRFGGR
jgi:hypothetical protein